MPTGAEKQWRYALDNRASNKCVLNCLDNKLNICFGVIPADVLFFVITVLLYVFFGEQFIDYVLCNACIMCVFVLYVCIIVRYVFNNNAVNRQRTERTKGRTERADWNEEGQRQHLLSPHTSRLPLPTISCCHLKGEGGERHWLAAYFWCAHGGGGRPRFARYDALL